jgi:hypothetical protein
MTCKAPVYLSLYQEIFSLLSLAVLELQIVQLWSAISPAVSDSNRKRKIQKGVVFLLYSCVSFQNVFKIIEYLFDYIIIQIFVLLSKAFHVFL